SFPNHMFLFAATSGGAISNPGVATRKFQVLDPATGNRTELETLPPDRVPTTLANELEKKGLAWTIFQDRFVVPFEPIVSGTLFDIRKFNDAIDVMRGLPDFEDRNKLTPFLDDRLPEYLAKGWGGHVSWIKPDPFKSGHPTISTVDDAQAWTKK